MILGYNKNNQPIEIKPQIFNGHALVLGGTGSGKSTLLQYYMPQVAPEVQGFWVFDFRKKEFSPLKAALEKKGCEVMVLSGNQLKFNILQPPRGVGIDIWINVILDIIAEALGFGARSEKLSQQQTLRLYHQFGDIETLEKNKCYPCLHDLKESVEKEKKANYQAARAILDSLEPLLLANSDLFSCRYGWPIEELAKKKIIFELGGLSEIAKNLILGYLLISEFTRRIEAGFSNHKMDLLICCDESQRLISANNMGNVIRNMIGLVRGSGIGLILAAQSSNDIIPEVFSNTATKILGRCGSFADYQMMGRAMGLNAEQLQWARLKLKAGTFIGQLGSSDWRRPFVFTIPNIENFKVPYIPSPDANPLDYLTTVSAVSDDEPKETTVETKSVLESPQEYSLLKAIIENPMQPSSSYIKSAGISSKTAVKVRKSLLSKKMIREHSLGTGANGRGKILLEALPEAGEAVKLYESAGE